MFWWGVGCGGTGGKSGIVRTLQRKGFQHKKGEGGRIWCLTTVRTRRAKRLIPKSLPRAAKAAWLTMRKQQLQAACIHLIHPSRVVVVV